MGTETENDKPTENPVLTPRKAIREKCIDCSGGRQNPGYLKSIRECRIIACALHPHRMGKRPKPSGPYRAESSQWSCLANKHDVEEQS